MKPRLLAAVLLATIVVACFEAPLGDPKTSVIDHRLDGVWITNVGSDGRSFGAWTVAALDEHIYCVIASRVTLDDAGRATNGESTVFRGWLTQVAGSSFMSIESVVHLIPNNTVEKPFLSAQLSVQNDGTLVVKTLEPAFKHIGEVRDAKKLASIVEANMSDPELFQKPQLYRRCNSDRENEERVEKCLLRGG
jgi:hypothetical protein